MIIVNKVGYLEPEDITDSAVAAYMVAVKKQAMENERPVLVKTGFELTQKELRFLKACANRENVELNRIFRANVKKWLESQHYSYPVGLIADRSKDVVEMDFGPDDSEPHDYNDDLVGHHD